MIGQTLNGMYRVSELVGSGGFADVYLGRDLRSNTVVAIKVLHDNFADDPALVRRFFREAQLAQSLVDPHVVRVLDVGQDGSTYYLIMEYVQGHTLAHLIQTRGPLPIDEAVGYVEQVLQALAVAHRAGIIHRDIKPLNLMVTPGGLVKVMDFGIAKRTAVEALAQTTMYMGTPRYMSPEQAKGGSATAQSDLYAVAVTLYELLAGRTPFTADTPWQVLNLHMLAEPPPIRAYCSDVPPAIEAILARGLKKNPAQRFASAEEMLQALRDALPEAESVPPAELSPDRGRTLPASALKESVETLPRDHARSAPDDGVAPEPPVDVEDAEATPPRNPDVDRAPEPKDAPRESERERAAKMIDEIDAKLASRRQVAPPNGNEVANQSPSQSGDGASKASTSTPETPSRRRIPPLALVGAGAVAMLVFLFVLGTVVGPTPNPTPASTDVASPASTSRATAAQSPTMTPRAQDILTTALAVRSPASTPQTGATSVAAETSATPLVTDFTSRLYIDLFKDPTSGFPRSLTGDGFQGEYANGEYALAITSTQPSAAVVDNPKRTFGDFSYAVSAHLSTPAPNGSYGLVFRLQDAYNCYQFSVDPNLGEYALFKRVNNEVTPLVKWTASSAIKRGTASNSLYVKAQGSALSLYVNGTALTTVEDQTFSQGHVGMRIDSWSQPISARFSTLSVIASSK